ncbi:cytochrome-c peroxidase [Mucilaginibacter psychrotolerans]|uniref:Cytochrome-c peroxidase n=1 Tax=Mucilaginibacter psychrotolerans TaxID=1524096 RepID=A0A4Y8SA65_9SPHI|nr:cytochrome c peroxidase [Mucilaginibacter psychrotolerans]TFF35772.1 cytochrome-c peroxidase [Mucilaginibacter psychrotolerans]
MSPQKILMLIAGAAVCISLIDACKKSDTAEPSTATTNTTTTTMSTGTANTAVELVFGTNINLASLENYAAQNIPAYITKDNCGPNPITNTAATLGRVLFYDKALSVNNSVACSSCHKQSLAFGDDALLSLGVNGATTRHSMRLANSRFTQEVRFFWDKRAATLEDQTVQPIQNHNEMGFSGTNGDPGIAALITKLQAIGYYQELFKFVYGDATVTQARMQTALSAFIRSIQSFDSKFDAGLAATRNLNQDFPNFTAQENLGKSLFINPPSPPGTVVNGAGCQGCHRAPEFDIDPKALNNGIIGVAGSTAIDISNTKAPSLRNVLNATGAANGMFMHNGSLTTLQAVVAHYNQITVNPANTNLDPRLNGGGRGQNLRLSADQQTAIVAFLATLSGKDVYTNKKWGNPFQNN